jgi:hypothetical protein
VSDGFSIAELRASAERYAEVHHERGPGAVVTPEAVLALVEATEAARWYFAQSVPYSGDPDADLAQERLRDALRPFTFPGIA